MGSSAAAPQGPPGFVTHGAQSIQIETLGAMPRLATRLLAPRGKDALPFGVDRRIGGLQRLDIEGAWSLVKLPPSGSAGTGLTPGSGACSLRDFPRTA